MSGFRPRFFAPVSSGPAGPSPDTGGELTLDADDSHHALRVLRLRPGDECEVVVGAAVYAATVLGPAPGVGGKAKVLMGGRLEGQSAGAYYRFRVGLVQALARNAAMDWTIEKSTEAGASFFLLVQAAGSPRWSGKDVEGRLARWARIAREAAKQSKQSVVPPVDLALSFAVAEERLRSLDLFSVFLDPGAGRSLYDVAGLLAKASPPQGGERAASPPEVETGGVALWVGPEGGWSDDERESLLAAGMTPARLGRGVLRTETVGPVALAVTRLALGDW